MTTHLTAPPTTDRWIQVGHSQLTDARAAGVEATKLAMADQSAKLLVVFCAHDYDLKELLAGINETSGGVPLVGCSTAGEIAAAGVGTPGVVITAWGGDGFTITTSVSRDISTRLREAGAEVAECGSKLSESDHQILMLLTDGLAGDQDEIVRGAYSVLGAGVPLVGGCAGDDLNMKETWQLYNDEVLNDSLVAVAIGSNSPLGIGVQHGWRRVGEAMMVTRSEGNRVMELDDRPALDAYLERLNAPELAHTDPAAFTEFAMTHPLGINRRSGEEVRYIAEANFEDRSLGCIARVPEGGLAWLMEGDDDSVLEATDAACRDALKSLDGAPPVGIIAFDCVARRGVLGDTGIQSEIDRISQNAGGAPVAGFYTYGEIARTFGVNGFHNQTLVVLAVG